MNDEEIVEDDINECFFDIFLNLKPNTYVTVWVKGMVMPINGRIIKVGINYLELDCESGVSKEVNFIDRFDLNSIIRVRYQINDMMDEI